MMLLTEVEDTGEVIGQLWWGERENFQVSYGEVDFKVPGSLFSPDWMYKSKGKYKGQRQIQTKGREGVINSQANCWELGATAFQG